MTKRQHKMTHQYETVTLLKTLTSIKKNMTKYSSTKSDISHEEFLYVPNMAGTIHKTMVGDKTATILPTRCPDSGSTVTQQYIFSATLHNYNLKEKDKKD